MSGEREEEERGPKKGLGRKSNSQVKSSKFVLIASISFFFLSFFFRHLQPHLLLTTSTDFHWFQSQCGASTYFQRKHDSNRHIFGSRVGCSTSDVIWDIQMSRTLLGTITLVDNSLSDNSRGTIIFFYGPTLYSDLFGLRAL